MESRGKKKPRNKSTKTAVVFDASARTEFLTGFRKRKNERKRKAKEQIEKDLKEVIKRSREKAKQDFSSSKGKGRSHRVVPEVEHLLTPSVQDVGTHTVSVTHVDSLSALPVVEQSEESHSPSLDVRRDASSDAPSDIPSKAGMKKINKMLTKTVSKSRAFKMSKQQLQGSYKSSSNLRRAKLFSRKTARSKRMKHYNPKKID